jgi:transketolase
MSKLQGDDVLIISSGIMTMRALEAMQKLTHDHIKAAVLHVPTVKPLYNEAIIAQSFLSKVNPGNSIYGQSQDKRRRRHEAREVAVQIEFRTIHFESHCLWHALSRSDESESSFEVRSFSRTATVSIMRSQFSRVPRPRSQQPKDHFAAEPSLHDDPSKPGAER